ncbi:Pum2, partial [Symbiodinium pilosum]
VGRKSLTSTLEAVAQADERSPFLEILSNDNMRPPVQTRVMFDEDSEVLLIDTVGDILMDNVWVSARSEALNNQQLPLCPAKDRIAMTHATRFHWLGSAMETGGGHAETYLVASQLRTEATRCLGGQSSETRWRSEAEPIGLRGLGANDANLFALISAGAMIPGNFVQSSGAMAVPVIGAICSPMPVLMQPVAFTPNAVPIMAQPVQPLPLSQPCQPLMSQPCQDIDAETPSLPPSPSGSCCFSRVPTGSTTASVSSFGGSLDRELSERSMTPVGPVLPPAPEAGSVKGHVWQFCQKQNGCRRVQEAIDACGSDQERNALAMEIAGHVWEAVRCPFGNYVVQRFITLLRPRDCQFIIDEISSQGKRAASQLARHRLRGFPALGEVCSGLSSEEIAADMKTTESCATCSMTYESKHCSFQLSDCSVYQEFVNIARVANDGSDLVTGSATSCRRQINVRLTTDCSLVEILSGDHINSSGGQQVAFTPNAVPIMAQPVQPPPLSQPRQDIDTETSSLAGSCFSPVTTGSTTASTASVSSFGSSFGAELSERSMTPVGPTFPPTPEAGSVKGHVWQLCQKENGCRRVQEAIDACGSDEERAALAMEIVGHVWEAVRCPFGNYVVQRFITLLRPRDCQFIIDEILSQGKRALQLVRHQYGNFVMQRILSHGTPAQQRSLCQLLRPQACDLATDQNASAVLAKALIHCCLEDKISLANGLLSRPGLLVAMSKTRHGHQTALALLHVLEGANLTSALDALKKDLPSLTRLRYGRVVHLGITWRICHSGSKPRVKQIAHAPETTLVK